MSTVDDRIVSMKFDNKSFEQNVATTIGTVDKLKSSLDFSKAKQNFGDLATASSALKLDGIAAAVEGISSKFSAMGVVALTVISNVVNRAVDAGVKLGKALSLDQMIGGFREYETNMNAIQTVLANTKSDGTNLQDVNKALDQLNEYSDQTIYNFGEMARNIGTFTAAGVNLDTSVSAIKGIANLAAISGSNSQQASTAMYQLSQALAAGSVKLMDWNSIVNAGMGGEVFQKSLFETGKTLGTIKDVPIDMTFEEWTKAGNTFRGSLEQGWLTSEVLTNTLEGFTGDLTDAQLQAMGYNAEQIKQIQEMGKTGKEAATKVKTLTQLISTVKESIGSGWSASFRIIFGDFEEARTLFTELSNAIGGVVGANADARNSFLQGWKDLGGRTALIDALRVGIQSLAKVLSTIKSAFTEIFPPMTSKQLYDLTLSFKQLMSSLTPSKETLDNIKSAALGFFSVFRIGVEILKGVAKVLKTAFDALTSFGDGGVLSFLGNLGEKIVGLKETLVDGEVISDFFNKLSIKIDAFVRRLNIGPIFDAFISSVTGLKDAVVGFFTGGGLDGFATAGENIKARFGAIAGVFGRVGDALQSLWDKLEPLRKLIGRFADFVQEKLVAIPQIIANVFAKTDYNQALDTVNTGLFAGLVLLVKKFVDNGFKFDIGDGLFGKLGQSFEALTGTLEAMQMKLKAEALFKIAAALALLTGSILVLSMINSGDLTKAMVAIGIGFAQLGAAMVLLDKFMTTAGAAKIAAISVGLVALSGAMLLLALAAKVFATMSWEELGKGLGAIAALLLVLSGAVKLMSGNAGGMITTGIGLVAIAVALNILAGAVKLFAMMSWAELAKGMTAVAVGLGIMAAAVNLMPNGPGMVFKGVGLIAIAVALNILAGAIKLFALMSWKEIGKGMAAVAAGLFIIALAMRIMPNGVNLTLQGAGLLLISVALNAIAAALLVFSTMSWGELAKGLVGMAASLLILAGAMALMSGAIPGAIALGITSAALIVLTTVIKQMAKLSWGDLLKGLVGIAAVLGIVVAAAALIYPVLPALLGLGIALALVGAGFALFGLGANLVATAFAVIATAGTQGIATLASAIDLLVDKLPGVALALGEAIVALAGKILEALPGFVTNLGLVIGALLQLVIDNIPKIIEVFVTFIQAGLGAIGELAPDIIATGLQLLLDFLHGISDNIEEVTNTVIDIVLKFIDSITARLPEIITSGTDLLVAFLKGIGDNLADVISAAGDVVAEFITAIGAQASKIVTAGIDALTDFLDGIADAIPDIAATVTAIFTEFLLQIGKNVPDVVDAFFQMFIDLFNGLASTIRRRSGELGRALGGLAGALAAGIGNALKEAIKQIANDLFPGLGNVVSGVLDFFGIASPSKLFYWIGDMLMQGLSNGIFQNMQKPEDSLVEGSERMLTNMQDSMSKLADVISQDIETSPTITPVLDLTEIAKGTSELNSMIESSSLLAATLANDQASAISVGTATDTTPTEEVISAQPREIKFEQHNYSPEALSTADIYRQTNNLIAVSKQELAVV
jgi:tape measure domain-containing protein